MGEVDEAAAPARKIEDPSALNVDPDRGERLYKSAIIHTKQGTTYRMVAKMLPIGKLDIVHYACDLLPDGTPEGKRRVNRIRSEEHTSELQSQFQLVCRPLLEKKKQ